MLQELLEDSTLMPTYKQVHDIFSEVRKQLAYTQLRIRFCVYIYTYLLTLVRIRKTIIIYSFHPQVHKSLYGSHTGEDMMQKLDEYITAFNNKHKTEQDPGPFVVMVGPGEPIPGVDRGDDGDLSIAIATPMMKRANRLCPEAQDIMFCDSTGSLAVGNTTSGYTTTFNFINTQGGTMCGGVIITRGQNQPTLEKGFRLHQYLLDPKAAYFYRGREKGAAVAMCDNSDFLHNAIRAVYGGIYVVLCLFHIVQQVWRWLRGSSERTGVHGPALKKRCLNFFRSIVYSKKGNAYTQTKHVDVYI